MPLLDDAKNCFVGQTQIKQIYAGTQKVWPKVPKNPGCYPPASAIAFYHFEDDFENSEGSSPSLSVQNGLFEFQEGIFGKCIAPVGLNETSELTAKVDSVLRPLTLECWLKVTDEKNSFTVAYSSKNINDPDLLKDSNDLAIRVVNKRLSSYVGYFNPSGTGSGLTTTFADAGIILGEWFHVAAACDPSSGKQYLWANGNFQSANLSPFDISKPLENLGLSASLEKDAVTPITTDELRLSKEIHYPLHDIFPCSEAPVFGQVGMPIQQALPGGSTTRMYYPVSFKVRSDRCELLPAYESRWAFSSNYPGGDGTTPPATWRAWEPLWGSSKMTVLDRATKTVYWANPYAEMEGTGQGYYMWNEVRERDSKKIVVPPCQTDVTAPEIPYPTTYLLCNNPPVIK